MGVTQGFLWSKPRISAHPFPHTPPAQPYCPTWMQGGLGWVAPDLPTATPRYGGHP